MNIKVVNETTISDNHLYYKVLTYDVIDNEENLVIFIHITNKP